MNREEFYQEFVGFDGEIRVLQERLEERERDFRYLEERVGRKRFIQDVVRGLRDPPKNDPGKNGPAYYFVGGILEDDISRADEPSLFMPCTGCKRECPVVMEYYQTEDSPSGDVWNKRAFTVCQEDGAYDVANFDKDHRF